MSIHLGPGLRGPFLLGGALDLRVVRVVHLVIVLVRVVLDLLHAALARNVCRFSVKPYAGRASLYAGDTRWRGRRGTDVHTDWCIANNMAVGKGGGRRNAPFIIANTADGVAPRLRRPTPDGSTVPVRGGPPPPPAPPPLPRRSGRGKTAILDGDFSQFFRK